MNKSIGGIMACLLGLAACNVEHYEDCTSDDFDSTDDFGGSHSRAGSSSRAGTDAGGAGAAPSSGSTASGGTETGGSAASGSAGTSTGAAGEPAVVVVTPCERERDCDAGYNCNLETHECEAAAEETCGELETEAACTHRSDCTPIYGGTNCSCGADCECQGGEPGCICESFEFFVCRAAE